MNPNLIRELDKKVSESLKNDEIPIGAVIFDENSNIIASASNTRQKDHNVLGHAEISAILEAEKRIGDWRLDGYSLLVNLEPCNMCTTIIKEARLDKIYYFIKNNGVNNFSVINKEQLDIIKYKINVDKYKELLSTYFKNKR